jgi:hypothetical protein
VHKQGIQRVDQRWWGCGELAQCARGGEVDREAADPVVDVSRKMDAAVFSMENSGALICESGMTYSGEKKLKTDGERYGSSLSCEA